ncbi:MAG: MFS transporter [Chloroflexota bacterium]
MRISQLCEQIQSIPASLRRFLISVVAYGIGFEGISTVLLNLYLLRLGYGTEFIGTLNSAGLLIFACVSLPIGAVQRITSRQMLLMGQVLTLIGLLGLPLALYVESGQGALLIGLRIVGMIGLSCYFVHQLPFAMEITSTEDHSKAMAITMAAFSFSTFLGSWLGGLLPEWFGAWLNLPLTDPRPFQLPMFVAALILIPAYWAIFTIKEPTREAFAVEEKEEDEAAAGFSGWRSIAGLVAIILVVRAMQTAGVGVSMTFTNVYFDEALGVLPSRIGLYSGLGRLLGVPLSLTIPWLVGRFGNFRLVHISLGLIVLLLLPMALVPLESVAALALISINSMGSLRYLSFIAFTMSLVSDKQRSLMSGVGEMAIGAGFSITSLLGGYIIAWYGYRELFLFGAAVTTIGAIAFYLIFRSRASSVPPRPKAAPSV